jgi:hypothetical protein
MSPEGIARLSNVEVTAPGILVEVILAQNRFLKAQTSAMAKLSVVINAMNNKTGSNISTNGQIRPVLRRRSSLAAAANKGRSALCTRPVPKAATKPTRRAQAKRSALVKAATAGETEAKAIRLCRAKVLMTNPKKETSFLQPLGFRTGIHVLVARGIHFTGSTQKEREKEQKGERSTGNHSQYRGR